MGDEVKFCFIVQYYGEFPTWFPLFLKSCENNKGIDWLFFVDKEYKKDVPPNVKFHLQNSNDFQKVCVDKFGHEVELMCYKGRKGKVKGFYKLCDYRPMYGFLFEDYLKNYDYWGWCDIDMIFGDLFNYVKSIANNGHECISFADHPDAFPYGPCTLIKNCEKMNKLFMKSRDIQKVLTEERHFQFDEDWKEDVHSIGHVMQDEGVNFLKTSIGNDDAKNRGHGENSGVKRNWKINWKNGKLFHRKKEIGFFHFGQTKQWVDDNLDFDSVCNWNDIWFNYENLGQSNDE